MANQSSTSTRGRNKNPTPNDVLKFMEKRDRRVWAISTLAEKMGFTPSPVRDRLKTLVRRGQVEKIVVGGTTAYYPREELEDAEPDVKPEKGPQSITDHLSETYAHRFLGTEKTWKWETPVYETVHSAETVQLLVEGGESGWDEISVFVDEEHRDELYSTEKFANSVQALITVGVVRKPTTPIEHIYYPSDMDLEAWAEECPALFEPSNAGIFVMMAYVDDISRVGEGNELMSKGAEDPVEELDTAGKELLESISNAD